MQPEITNGCERFSQLITKCGVFVYGSCLSFGILLFCLVFGCHSFLPAALVSHLNLFFPSPNLLLFIFHTGFSFHLACYLSCLFVFRLPCFLTSDLFHRFTYSLHSLFISCFPDCISASLTSILPVYSHQLCFLHSLVLVSLFDFYLF